MGFINVSSFALQLIKLDGWCSSEEMRFILGLLKNNQISEYWLFIFEIIGWLP